ncbi:MAG: hypothetical protein AAF985_07940 [Bacteroidota bacterium]
MANREFDDLIADKLRRTQSFEIRAADWEQVAEQLATKRRKRGGLFLLWALGGVATLLTCLSIYLWVDLNEAKKRIAYLEQNNDSIETPIGSEQATNENIIIVDTIFKYDTIVQQVWVTKHNGWMPDQDHQRTTAINRSYEKPYLERLNPSDFSLPSKNYPPQTLLLVPDPKALTSATFSTTEELTLATLNSPSLDFSSDFRTDFALTYDFAEESGKKLKAPRQSKRLSLGLIGSWGRPDRYSATYTAYLNERLSRSNLGIGLQIDYRLLPRLTGYLASSYQKLTYQTSQFEGLWRIDLSQIEFPSEAYSIEKVRMDQRSLQHRLGFNYVLLGSRPWQLYLGLSIEASSFVKQKLKVNTRLIDPPVYAEAENDFQREDNRSIFTFHSLLPTAGFQLHWSKHFSSQVEVWHRYQWKDASLQLFDRHGLRTVLRYHF